MTSIQNDSGVITLLWNSSSVVDEYMIFVAPPVESGSIFTTPNTTIQITVCYNQEYNISVVANNCAGSSTPAEIIVGKLQWIHCPPPIVGLNVSVEVYSSVSQGSQITYYCQPGLLPSERMVATCGNDGYWSPNPAELSCKGT